MRTNVRLGIERCPPAFYMHLSSVGRCPPPAVQSGDTALTRAALNKKWDTVRLLVTRKAEPSIPDKVRLIIECLDPTANTNPDANT